MAYQAPTAAINAARHATKEMHGIVVSAGLMDKTVKVKLGGLRWEPKVQKFFKESRFRLVHDPRNSLRQGDVVAITHSRRISQHVRHIVKHIVAPYGEPIHERPPVPTVEEFLTELEVKRALKKVRRETRKMEEELAALGLKESEQTEGDLTGEAKDTQATRPSDVD